MGGGPFFTGGPSGFCGDGGGWWPGFLAFLCYGVGALLAFIVLGLWSGKALAHGFSLLRSQRVSRTGGKPPAGRVLEEESPHDSASPNGQVVPTGIRQEARRIHSGWVA